MGRAGLSRLLRRWLALDDDADGWQRPAPTATQQRLDLVIGLGLGAATVGSAVLAQSVGITAGPARPGLPVAIAWCLAVSLPLVARRRYPLSVLVLVSAAFIGLQSQLVAEQQMSAICLFLALFSAGAWGRDRRATRIARIAVVVVMFAWLAYALSATAWGEQDYGKDATGPIPPATASLIYVTALNVLYFGAAMAFGTMAWTQARQQDLLAVRNAELAAERDLNARRAVVAERLRIARELHDVVAHHVSLMGIQTAAARRVLDRDVELTRSTLEGVEETGRVAVDEMRRLLGVLRTSEDQSPQERQERQEAADGHGPAPGLLRLDELVARTTRAGLRTELAFVGEPFAIPTSVSVSGYRIAQEALTNTVRHAAATRADVRVRYLADAVEVEIVDDGRGAGGQSGGNGGRAKVSGGLGGGLGGGMGHVGMRERVAVHGGELEIGPRPGGGYRVRARLPVPTRLAASQAALTSDASR